MSGEPAIATAAGIVRAPRRPAGWVAPGPRPAAPRSLGPGHGEDLCHLAGDWRIFQKLRGHRWSLDDLVTAALAAEICPVPPRRILDLGSGIGSVALLLAWRFPQARLVTLEAQAESLALARRSIAWNGCAERCDARLGDLRDGERLAGEAPFDLVTGTPPYLPPGSATPPRRAEQPGCHLELRGDVVDYAQAAARALAEGGRFVLCHSSPERVARAADAAGLHLRVARDVIPRAGKAALFAVYALERARGEISRQPPLIVRDERGARTAEFSALRARMGMPP